MKLSVKQAEAALRLRNNPDFLDILEAINAYRGEAIEFTLYGPAESANINRGIARGTTEVLRGLGKAEQIVKTANEKQKNGQGAT